MINTNLNQMKIEDVSFVILDFETVTPKGRPPEPIELGAMRIIPKLEIDSQFKVNWLIRPPKGAPITQFDTIQTGIRWKDVRDASLAAPVLEKFDALLQDNEYILVAQNAQYEASIIHRFSNECRYVSKMPFVDTILLAKHLLPGLPNYKLDTLANHFSVAIPKQRHRALPDVEITVRIFLNLLEIGFKTNRITSVIDLKRIAGIKKKTSSRSIQATLFK